MRLHDSGGFLVDDPLLFILGCFIPVGRHCTKMFAGASFGLPRCPNFLAGIFCVHLVKYVADSGKLTIAAYTVHAVVDCDKMNAVIGKHHFRIHTHLQIVSPETGHILYHHTLDFAVFNISKHPLKTETVEVGSGITVVLVVVTKCRIAVVAAILFQYLFSIADTVAFAVYFILSG